jgi:hypothetical protein
VPIQVSTVSGVVIFADTSDDYVGRATGQPLCACASLAASVIAIAAAKMP